MIEIMCNMPRLRPCLLAFVALLTLPSLKPLAALAADGDAVEILVRERALSPSPSREAYAITRLEGHALEASAPARLDDLLKTVPGASLFRRASSRTAHPTTQGISLRGLGPNGAGRTLVLLDGIPQNDPFGGWIYWSALPASGLAGVDVIRGGGAGPFGNAALSGTVALTSRAIHGTGGYADGRFGSRDTLSLTGAVQVDTGAAEVFAGGHYFDSDGYQTLRADQRGPIDQPLASEAMSGYVGGRIMLDEITTFTVRAGAFEEERENGTPDTFNNTRGYDLSLRLVREAADGNGFEITLYGQDRRFENQFASVNADRTADSPALNQFRVPSDSLGATALVRETLSLGGVIEAGADIRLLDGETNERFFLSDGVFLRERRAGGEQILAGAFAEYTTAPLAAIRITGGVRLDYLKDRKGGRVERALDTGATLRDEQFTARDHWVLNGRLGAIIDAGEQTRLRAAAYSGFRLPTINELYRPFRVRTDITEANPELEPERLYGLEAGIDVSPDPALTLTATAFANWLNNAVANVLITDVAGFNPDLGVFVPGGGSLSQRRNLDRVRAFGLEISLDWRPAPEWSARLDYLLTDAQVARAPDQPALEGKRPPQTARHQGSLTLGWSPDLPVSATMTLYGATRQFDDSLELRPIGGYVAADLYIGYRIEERLELFATAENLFDTEIETGNASNGLVSVGRPRLLALGLRTSF